MKKYLIIFLLLIFPSLSFATSGSCSSHGGVNCNVISAIDGSAICNDGYVSSTLYVSTDECNKNTNQSYCIPPITSTCSTDSDYSNLVRQGIASGSQEYDPSWSQTLSVCKSAITNYQAQQLTYLTCLNKPQKKYSEPTKIYPQKQDTSVCYESQEAHDKAVKDINDLTTKMEKEAEENLNNVLKNPSIDTTAFRAVYDIQQGLLNNLKEIRDCKIIKTTPDESCKKQYGIYSIQHPTKADYCGCEKGYYFSKTEPSQCVPIDDYYCSLDNQNYDKDNKICVEKVNVSTVPKNSIQPSVSTKEKIETKKSTTPNSMFKKFDQVLGKTTQTVEQPITSTTNTQEVKAIKPSFIKIISLWFINLFK
ncbi:MAG: hypothetical protein WCI41_01625 [bacterium]